MKSQFGKLLFHLAHKKYFSVLLCMKAVLSLNFETDRNLFLDTQLNLKLQLFKERLFDAFKIKSKIYSKIRGWLRWGTKNVFSFCKQSTKFSILQLWIFFNNAVVYIARWIYPHKAQISNESKSPAVSNKEILDCHGYNFEEHPEALICIRSLIEQIP